MLTLNKSPERMLLRNANVMEVMNFLIDPFSFSSCVVIYQTHKAVKSWRSLTVANKDTGNPVPHLLTNHCLKTVK